MCKLNKRKYALFLAGIFLLFFTSIIFAFDGILNCDTYPKNKTFTLKCGNQTRTCEAYVSCDEENGFSGSCRIDSFSYEQTEPSSTGDCKRTCSCSGQTLSIHYSNQSTYTKTISPSCSAFKCPECLPGKTKYEADSSCGYTTAHCCGNSTWHASCSGALNCTESQCYNETLDKCGTEQTCTQTRENRVCKNNVEHATGGTQSRTRTVNYTCYQCGYSDWTPWTGNCTCESPLYTWNSATQVCDKDMNTALFYVLSLNAGGQCGDKDYCENAMQNVRDTGFVMNAPTCAPYTEPSYCKISSSGACLSFNCQKYWENVNTGGTGGGTITPISPGGKWGKPTDFTGDFTGF